MMSARRSRLRSRYGCKQCKDRKIKCDEGRPSCQKCTVRGDNCSLQFLEARPSHIALLERSLSTPRRQSPSLDRLAKEDLQLYHFFLRNTAPTLSFNNEALEVWRWIVPELAFETECLLHCILGIGAYHYLTSPKAQLPQADRTAYLIAAEQHYNLALSLSIPALRQVKESNCQAICCFNLLFALFPYARRQAGQNDCLTTLIESFKIYAGTDAIIDAFSSTIFDSDIRVFFEVPPFEELPAIPAAAADILRELEREADGVVDVRRRGEYVKQVEVLRRLVQCCEMQRWQAYVFSFATAMSSAALRLLEARDEFMLTCLAFWTCCVKGMTDRWWMAGWTEDLVAEIAKILSKQWLGMVERMIGMMDRHL